MPSKELRAHRHSLGLCTECGSPDRPLVTKLLCNICRNKKNAAIRDMMIRRRNKKLCPLCGTALDDGVICKACRIRKRNISKISNAKLKIETFEAYGGVKCNCCGETTIEFLDLDHINGGGNIERRLHERRGGCAFYRRLRKRGYPPGFQVLCANCNRGKSICGICPHMRTNNV